MMLLNNGCIALHFPLLESVQIEKGPCQKCTERFRGDIHKAQHTKGDMKKEKGDSEIRSDSTQKCTREYIIKKSVFVSVCTLFIELIAIGILSFIGVKAPKKMMS